MDTIIEKCTAGDNDLIERALFFFATGFGVTAAFICAITADKLANGRRISERIQSTNSLWVLTLLCMIRFFTRNRYLLTPKMWQIIRAF